MTTVDTCIHARWIIPVVPRGAFFEHHSIVISQGRIVEIAPTETVRKKYQAEEHVDLSEHLLIPGLINNHTHTPMSLMRGLADDLPLMEWLNDHIWPAENRWVSEPFVRTGSLLAMAEMLRAGTTTFNDMYFYPDVVAETAIQVGMRAHVGAVVFDFPSGWGKGPEEYFEKAEQLMSSFKGNPLVTCQIGPHAPYTVSDENLRKTLAYAERHDCQINIHLHETEDEVQSSLKQYGKRPIERLTSLGFLSPRVIAVHMTTLDDSDFAHLAKTQPHIVTCPESNLKLASGFCPVQRLVDAGLNVSIGTDGAASNNDCDMLAEMRSTALLAKAVAKNPTACDAAQTLEMATINAAKALKVDDRVGSLTPGKQADITAIALNELECMPLYQPISQLVYTTNRHQVSDVWVAGKRLLQERQLTTIDTETLIAEVREWQVKLA